MLGPEIAAVAEKKKAATVFGEGTLQRHGARASSSSSSIFSSYGSPAETRRTRTRFRHALVARMKKGTAIAAAKKDEEAPSPKRRQPRKKNRSCGSQQRGEEVRSRETTAVAVTSRRQARQRDIEVRSPETTAVAASRSPPPPSFVPRKNIKPRRDLQQKERVRQSDFGYSSSGDQPASRSRGMHTREQARGSLGLQNKRPRRRYKEPISMDSRDVSPVDAWRPCKPLPESSSSESRPKRSSVKLVPAKATRQSRERREIRNRSSSPQLRRQLRDFEELAEPSQWRPQAAFGAESITQALPQSWSEWPHGIGNLIFGTSYVSDLAEIARFQEWLTKSPIHCHVVLCQTPQSAVADWLGHCCRTESASFHVLLESKRVIYITARVFMVLLRRHVEHTGVRQALTVEEIDFAVAHIKIYQRSTAVAGRRTAVAGCRTAVAVGIVHVMPQLLMNLPEWLMKEKNSVDVHSVRCLTGTFGNTAQQMSCFAHEFPMATMTPVAQMWRGTGGSVDVFPAYTLLLGSASQVSTPAKSDMITSAVAVQQSWASTICPWDMVMPSWGRGRDSRFLDQQSVANDTDWGHIKIKKVDPKRWIPHVHQVVFWCGIAEQGAGAWARMHERSSRGKAASSTKQEAASSSKQEAASSTV